MNFVKISQFVTKKNNHRIFAKNGLVLKFFGNELNAKIPISDGSNRIYARFKAKVDLDAYLLEEYCHSISSLNFNGINASHAPNTSIYNELMTPDSLGKAVSSKLKKIRKSIKLQANNKDMLERLLSKHPYHNLYSRPDDRKITVLCAPTNSGKTYRGMQIIKEALRNSPDKECQMLFPLRVLALQIQDDFNAEGIPASLLTGEEQDIQDNAFIKCSTVEIFNNHDELSTVFLDEGQLAFSDARSAGYLHVICSAKCDHLVISCAPAALKQMKWYLGEVLKVPFEVQFLERLTSLTPCENPIKFNDIQDGDLLVAFSRKKIHTLANKLAKSGFNVGTIYGALSPAARRSMLKTYRERGFQILVASDAIGLGVSAPAKRVIFHELEKFDGVQKRPLTEEEIRQIAGRAGRFGFEEKGEAGVIEGQSPNRLKKILTTHPTELDIPNTLYVSPDKSQIYAAKELGLESALLLWQKAISKHSLYAVSTQDFADMLTKAKWLDKKVEKGELSFDIALKLLFVTFQVEGDFTKFPLYKAWIENSINGIKNDFEKVPPKASLDKLEDMSADLTLMIQLSRVIPEGFTVGEDKLNHQQNILGRHIALILTKKYSTNK